MAKYEIVMHDGCFDHLITVTAKSVTELISDSKDVSIDVDGIIMTFESMSHVNISKENLTRKTVGR